MLSCLLASPVRSKANQLFRLIPPCRSIPFRVALAIPVDLFGVNQFAFLLLDKFFKLMPYFLPVLWCIMRFGTEHGMRATVASCGNPVRQSPQYLKDDPPDDAHLSQALDPQQHLSHALILVCFSVDAGIWPCHRRLLSTLRMSGGSVALGFISQWI